MSESEDISNSNPKSEQCSESQISQHIEKIMEKQNEKPDLPRKDVVYMKESESDQAPAQRFGNLEELTLNHLCNNSISCEEILERNLSISLDNKRKDHDPDNINQEMFVERDFLNLNEAEEESLKQEVYEDIGSKEKKPKLDTLNLSLALPDVALFLAASNPLQNGNIHNQVNNGRGLQANSDSQTLYSNDFTAASFSYSYSHPFSHNPSCSLTRNSTENHDFSTGSHRRHLGEGTNGSVHSRFKPIGDAVQLSDHGGSSYPLMRCNSLHRTGGTDSQSLFPSELPARARFGTESVGSRGRTIRGFDGGRMPMSSKPQRILHQIVVESIHVIAQMVQELPEELVQQMIEYLHNLLRTPKNGELIGLQERLCRRSDLSIGILSKADKCQLEILVAVKTGLPVYLSGKHNISTAELAEILLSLRCRNLNCKSLLPVDDCDCKICSENKGFCRECMCPVCFKFDCANNTCSWVGCDVCSHWCHAACGIRQKLIKPGPSLKGPLGTTEMQFHCNGCGHASEMFGFVKDVFICCARDWNSETLMKELECVMEIFEGSEDFKGRELETKAKEMLQNLKSKGISSSDARLSITQFFNRVDDAGHIPLPLSSHPPNYMTHNTKSTGKPTNLRMMGLIGSVSNERTSLKDESLISNGFDSLESIVRIKELEARMFQTRADEARRDAASCIHMIQERKEKMEEEYNARLLKLRLQETEERRRKKLDELNVLENSRCDYYNMKMRMQAEIAGLLERMDATKKFWA